MKIDRYSPSFIFRNGHTSTIYAALVRKINGIGSFTRFKINTPDDDFFEIDYFNRGNHTIAVLVHGLEGNSQRPYMRGMAKILISSGFDVILMNHRGCSGEENKTYKTYHSGYTDDLAYLVDWINQYCKPQHIVLIGFSLGGSIVLHYLSGLCPDLNNVCTGIAVSTPLDLGTTVSKLDSGINRIYVQNFLHTLVPKARKLCARFPDVLSFDALSKINSLQAYDRYVTARIFNFYDETEYYNLCSPFQVINTIQVPFFILAAKDDPFLNFSVTSDILLSCPNPYLKWEHTRYGGHVGWPRLMSFDNYWHEVRIMNYLQNFNLSITNLPLSGTLSHYNFSV